MKFLDRFYEDYVQWRRNTMPMTHQKIHFVQKWAKINEVYENFLWDTVLLCDYELYIKEYSDCTPEQFVDSWSYYYGLFVNKTKEQMVLCIKSARITNPTPQNNKGESVQVVLNGVRVFLESKVENPQTPHIHTIFMEVFDADTGNDGTSLTIRNLNSNAIPMYATKKFAIDFTPKNMGEAQDHIDNIVKEEDAKEPKINNPEDLKLWLTWHKQKKQRLFYAFQKFHIPEEHQSRYYKEKPWKEVIAKHLVDLSIL